jgi:Zn finger protein HypA/HybF involved in hydrogenase expression
MPEYYEHRQKPLKCQDCGHEFMGSADYVVHTVDGQTVRAVFNRADAKCPRCGSHAVTLKQH